MKCGEAGALFQYFQKQLLDNPSFFHAYQMDSGKQITHIFWANAKMMIDGVDFGDVVSLDTTFCTNIENRPLALFCGFRSTVILGTALLYDETQLSESLSSCIKSLMRLDVNISLFFKYFESIVDDKRHSELKHELDAKQKILRLRMPQSLMLQQLPNIYTPKIFELFQEEYDKYVTACIREKNESEFLWEYVVFFINKEGHYKVVFDPSNNDIKCSCNMFQSVGILCCHALKIYDVNDMKIIPDHYILNRWTKKVRSPMVHDSRGKEIQGDPRLKSTQRYKWLYKRLIRLASEAFDYLVAYEFLDNLVFEATKHVSELHLMEKGSDSNMNNTTSPSQSNLCPPHVAGLKKKDNLKHKRCFKSCVEVRGKKNKGAKAIKDSQV